MGGITVQNVNQKVTQLIEGLFIGLKIFFSAWGQTGRETFPEILCFPAK
jgi:hypothetical protein